MSRKSSVMKECTCQYHEGENPKSLSDFYLNKTKEDGHNDICSDCQAKVNEKNKK